MADNGIGRRAFLEWAIGLLGGAIGVALGIPIVGYLLAPLRTRRRRQLIPLMAEADLPLEGEVAEVLYTVPIQDGWRRRREVRIAYVVNRGEQLLVLSNLCTHTGCGVRWESERQRFVCPCHGGEFDMEGRVMKEPPPRPLRRIAHQLRDGALWIEVEA